MALAPGGIRRYTPGTLCSPQIPAASLLCPLCPWVPWCNANTQPGKEERAWNLSQWVLHISSKALPPRSSLCSYEFGFVGYFFFFFKITHVRPYSVCLSLFNLSPLASWPPSLSMLTQCHHFLLFRAEWYSSGGGVCVPLFFMHSAVDRHIV